MTTPSIIIGSETEYGILISHQGGHVCDPHRNSFEIHDTIQHMLAEGMEEVGGVARDQEETFVSLKEHEEAERLLRRRGLDEDRRIHEWVERNALDSRRKDGSILRLLSEFEGILTAAPRGMAQRRGYSGSMLANGARFYDDMGHPEYSPPECRDPYTALCVQKSGDAIVQRAAERAGPLSVRLRQPVTITIIKNNSDGQGNSYAGHENYLVTPALFYALCADKTPESDATMLLFVARQIITGAGKIGSESGGAVPYQISQRADFIKRRFSASTVAYRGLINQRNSPYAHSHSRFHVIAGDSNRSDVSLFLKFGITALFFMMLESGFLRDSDFPWYGTALHNPVSAMHTVSRDLTLGKQLLFSDGRRATALQILGDLQKYAERFVSVYSLTDAWQRVVALWKDALEGLQGDRHAHPVSRSLDWVAVERILQHHANKYGVSFDSDRCMQLELRYRMLGEGSIYPALVERGQTMTIADKCDIERYTRVAPRDTRAWFRAECIKRYGEVIQHLRWDAIHAYDSTCIWLPNPLWGGEDDARELFAGEPTFFELVKRLQEGTFPNVEVCTGKTGRRR